MARSSSAYRERGNGGRTVSIQNGHALEAARVYISRGWSVVPIPAKSKGPVLDRWQDLRLTAEDLPHHFQNGCNVGTLTGEPSAWLVDVDLDHELAVQLADEFLPATACEFGRQGKQRSHRLYYVAGPVCSLRRKLPKVDGKAPTIAELRATGLQTVFPGSIHPSGERIEWASDGEPARVRPALLKAAVNALADEVERRLGIVRQVATSPKRASAPANDNAVLRAEKYLAKIPGAIEGQGGDDATFAVACVLVLGFNLTPDQAWPLLLNWNTQCVPPWDEKPLRRKLDEADKQPGDRGYLLAQAYSQNGKPSANTAPKTAPSCDSDLPEVQLPGGEITITSAAQRLAQLLDRTGKFYLRGGVATRLAHEDGQPRLIPIRPAALCSDLETVARLVRVQHSKDGETITPTTCSESAAKLILESDAFRSALSPIQVVTRCPVLTERRGELVVVSGYDREAGILAGGSAVPNVDLRDAVASLHGLVDEFLFATPGDKARGLAAIITPAMLNGGLLGGRAPMDLSEADESQAGKGFRNKLTGATYNSTVRAITQRSTGGVGSVQETFDSALVSGAWLTSFDNFRGILNLPGLESFLTEDRYLARVPYAAPMEIDPRRVVVMFTSNSAELTPDLANRCSCIRIQKQPADYKFKTYAEGDLLDHVVANQPHYLGCVFAVVREWHSRGKPLLESAGHDFRKWARTLGYISEHILGAGGLLVGHRAAQQRMASPGLTWLRDVALAVQRADQMGCWLRPHHLLTVIVDCSLDTPGIDTATLEDDGAWLKATQALGRKLGKLFRNGDTLEIDAFTIERQEGTDEQHRRKTEFAFFSATPNNPQ